MAKMSPVEAYIRQQALLRGIDPDVAARVIKAEGGFNDPYIRGRGPAPKSQAKGFGKTEHSFGPMQLYISGTGSGLGDRALKSGIDPRKDWQAGVRFGLDEVSRDGWRQWYGAKHAGVNRWDGINRAGGTGVPLTAKGASNPAIAQASLAKNATAKPQNIANAGSWIGNLAGIGQASAAPQTSPESSGFGNFAALLSQYIDASKAPPPPPIPPTIRMADMVPQKAPEAKAAETSQTPDAYASEGKKPSIYEYLEQLSRERGW